MNIWLIVYFVGSSVALLILILMVYWQRIDMAAMKELSEKLRDKWSQTEHRAKKLERGLDWFLARDGMTLDYSGCTWEWIVKPIHPARGELDHAWKQMADHREEIVFALYEANKRALHDWDREKSQAEKKKGAKK